MSVESPRRYYLLKSKTAARVFEIGLSQAWRAKQLEMPGEELRSDFPHRAKLAERGYLAREDLLGATTEELQQAGLSTWEAAAVLAAL